MNLFHTIGLSDFLQSNSIRNFWVLLPLLRGCTANDDTDLDNKLDSWLPLKGNAKKFVAYCVRCRHSIKPDARSWVGLRSHARVSQCSFPRVFLADSCFLTDTMLHMLIWW